MPNPAPLFTNRFTVTVSRDRKGFFQVWVCERSGAEVRMVLLTDSLQRAICAQEAAHEGLLVAERALTCSFDHGTESFEARPQTDGAFHVYHATRDGWLYFGRFLSVAEAKETVASVYAAHS